jgi:hypothetical protein
VTRLGSLTPDTDLEANPQSTHPGLPNGNLSMVSRGGSISAPVIDCSWPSGAGGDADKTNGRPLFRNDRTRMIGGFNGGLDKNFECVSVEVAAI